MLAFLDIAPLAPGHVLVIPKEAKATKRETILTRKADTSQEEASTTRRVKKAEVRPQESMTATTAAK